MRVRVDALLDPGHEAQGLSLASAAATRCLKLRRAMRYFRPFQMPAKVCSLMLPRSSSGFHDPQQVLTAPSQLMTAERQGQEQSMILRPL